MPSRIAYIRFMRALALVMIVGFAVMVITHESPEFNPIERIL